MSSRILLFILLIASSVFAADYEILEKNSRIDVQSSAFAAEHHRQVVKILTEKGTSYREILAVNGYIQIKNVRGSIKTPGGQTLMLKENSISELPFSDSGDMLTDYKALVVTPQTLDKGSVFTLEYDRYVTSLLYLEPCVFASSVPVRKTSCSVSFPSHIPIKYRSDEGSATVQKSEHAGRTTLLVKVSDQQEVIVLGNPEQYGGFEKKVVFVPEECMTEKWKLSTRTWQQIAEWFTELSQFAYQNDPAMDAVVNDVLAKHKNPEDVADVLYQYVQKQFIYTAIEIGIGGYKPRFAGQTFQKKYGDCKDLTLLYLALLKKAGIEGYPALVDTRPSRFFFQDFPTPSQFNHCIAFLPKIRNGVWVDSTVKNFRLGEVPSVIQGKQALVSGGPNTLMRIPENFSQSNVLYMRAQGSYADEELRMQGSVETSGRAIAYVSSINNALMKNQVKHYVYNTLLLQGLPVKKLEADYQDERTLRLSFSVPVQKSSPYRFLLVNAMNYPPLEYLAIDPQPNEFFSLGVPVRLVVESEIDLAGGTMLSIPVQKELRGEYVSFQFQMTEQAGKLKYLADVFFANGFLDPLQMKKYQQELREFADHIQRTAVVKEIGR